MNHTSTPREAREVRHSFAFWLTLLCCVSCALLLGNCQAIPKVEETREAQGDAGTQVRPEASTDSEQASVDTEPTLEDTTNKPEPRSPDEPLHLDEPLADNHDGGNTQDSSGEPDATLEQTSPEQLPERGVPEVVPEPVPEPTKSNKTVLFSFPSAKGKKDHTLEKAILTIISQAPKGSSIHASLYELENETVAKALLEANARGVQVALIFDGRNTPTSATKFAAIKLLQKGYTNPQNKKRPGIPAGSACTSTSSCMLICTNANGDGCIATRKNHNKFMLFSKLTDGSQNVVVQTSFNLVEKQLGFLNDLVIIRDDPALYQGMRKYWSDLRLQKKNPNYYRTVTGDTSTKAYFYPRSSGDTIANILKALVCKKGDSIHIAMAFFSDARKAIADELVRHVKAGCSVKVFVDFYYEEYQYGTTGAAGILKSLGKAGVFWGFPAIYKKGTSSAQNSWRLHTKILLIDAVYVGIKRQVVFTGSHNYTQSSLTSNDETLLRVIDPQICQAYKSFFTRLQKVSKIRP